MIPDLTRRAALLTGAALAIVPAACATTGGKSATDARLEALSRRWLEASLRLDPISATSFGEHRYDDQLTDYGPAGRAARRALAANTLAELQRVERAKLSRANQVDALTLENALRYQLWTHDTLQSWAWDPLTYNSAAGGALYGLMSREFAPLPVRLRAATARLEKLPALLAQTRASLVPARTPRIHADTVVSQNRGLKSLVDDQVLAQAGALPAAERARLQAAATAFKAALDEHQRWLETTLVPNAKGDFRLGAELYDAKLAFALNSPLSRAEIRTRAEAGMRRVRAEMYTLASQVLKGRPGAPATPGAPTSAQEQAAIAAALELAYADKPSRAGLVDAARETLAQATAFVRERDLITLPDTPVRIILTPEFQRGVAVAYADSPGPLDRGQQTFYSVSPIPDDWTAEQSDSFLREYNTRSLHELTIHEAVPGHYVQLWHSNRYPSTLRAVLQSEPFIEGWAVYAQDIMADAGYLGGDPLYKLVHLKWHLRVIANAILDQGIHVDGMTREAAMKLMVEGAFQQEREAAGKWVRAQLSSAQLPTYFVGWEEHRALQQEAQRAWGAGYTPKRYHDAVLAFGSPPVRHARQLLLDQPIV